MSLFQTQIPAWADDNFHQNPRGKNSSLPKSTSCHGVWQSQDSLKRNKREKERSPSLLLILKSKHHGIHSIQIHTLLDVGLDLRPLAAGERRLSLASGMPISWWSPLSPAFGSISAEFCTQHEVVLQDGLDNLWLANSPC